MKKYWHTFDCPCKRCVKGNQVKAQKLPAVLAKIKLLNDFIDKKLSADGIGWFTTDWKKCPSVVREYNKLLKINI